MIARFVLPTDAIDYVTFGNKFFGDSIKFVRFFIAQRRGIRDSHHFAEQYYKCHKRHIWIDADIADLNEFQQVHLFYPLGQVIQIELFHFREGHRQQPFPSILDF